MCPSEPTPPAPTISSGLTAAGVAAALILSILVAIQGGLVPRPSALPLVPEAPPLGSIVLGKLIEVIAITTSAVGVLLPLWLGAAGWGLPLRRLFFARSSAATPIQLTAGLGLMLMLAWLAAWAGALNQFTAWTLCAVGMVALAVQCLRPSGRHALAHMQVRLPWMLILPAPALGLLLVACACPPGTIWRVEAFAYDVLSYHLQVPREWLRLGAMTPLPHNVYSYFPNLAEVGFMQIGAMRGSMYGAIHATQLFHASLAVLGAWGAGCLAARHGTTAGGFLAAAALLATPWTLIVASSSYNEMFAVSMGAAALLLVFDPQFNRRGALMAGMLAGFATLAKLTAGPMLALPIGFLILLRLNRLEAASNRQWKRAIGLAATAALGGIIVLSPWLIRNAVWTGNPLFPFATGMFGRAHWSEAQVETWRTVHAPKGPPAQRIARLGPQWLFNTGYGGIFGRRRLSDAREVARFRHEGGVPVLWAAGLLCAVGLWIQPPGRRLAAAMLLILTIQVVFWMAATMQPSRYLVFTLLPGSILIGAGFGSLAKQSVRAVRCGVPVLAILLVGSLTAASFGVFHGQVRDPLRPWQVVDALPAAEALPALRPGDAVFGDHFINHLPPDSRTCMVADAVVFYTRRAVSYATAWDRGPLGEIIRDAGGSAATVTAELRKAGFTHIWIHWSELDRIHETVGRHDGLDAVALRRITREGRWRVVHDIEPIAALYDLR